MKEKRKFKRVPADTILMYQTTSDRAELFKVDTPLSIDISTDGLQMESDKKLPVKTPLEIVLSIVGTEVPLQLDGKVIWCKKIGKTKFFRVGVKFTRFTDEQQKKFLVRYVQSL